MKKLLLSLVFAGIANIANSQWIQTNGPYGGQVNCLAVSGSNIFAGTNVNGIFISSNDGLNWTAANTGLTGATISSFFVNGIDVFVGTFGAGIFLSSNNGQNWTYTGLAGASDLRSIIVSGSNIYIGASRVYLSTDYGSNWNMMNTGMPINYFFTLAKIGAKIFAGVNAPIQQGGGIYQSTNNCTSWFLLNSGMPNGNIQSLIVSDSNIFAGTVGGVFKLSNNDTIWIPASTGLTNLDIRSFAVSGTNIFAGTAGGGVFLSTDNGTTWTDVSTGLPAATEVYALALNGTYLFAGTLNGGVWRRPLADFNISSYSFSGKVFNDLNGNGIKDNGEVGIPNILVQTKSNGWVFNTDQNGDYNAFSFALNDSVSVVSPSMYATTFPQSLAVTDLDTGKDIAVHYIPNVTDLRITITNQTPARPGMNDAIYITYKNVGTNTMSGNVSLNFPNNDISFSSSTPSQSSISGNTVNWNFSNLQPNEQRNISVTFNVLATTAIGSLLVFNSAITPIVGDTVPNNNNSGIDQTVSGSFDPNYKEVIPNNGLTPQQVAAGEPLNYTIHFQNTGTDTAFNVKVIDTLSQYLDLSTFEVLSSSHPCTYSIRGAGIVEFYFNNILLPDSNINFIGSNGFVKFTIKPKSTLVVGNNITNDSYIYFDFNQPVLTNTTSTLIHLPSGITESISLENSFYLYPNPATDNITIITPQQVSIEILNIQGQIIKQLKIKENKTNINISDYASGVYIIRAQTDSGITTKKFIKE